METVAWRSGGDAVGQGFHCTGRYALESVLPEQRSEISSQHASAVLPSVKAEDEISCCDVAEQSKSVLESVLPEQRPVISWQHASTVLPSVKAEDEISCC